MNSLTKLSSRKAQYYKDCSLIRDSQGLTLVELMITVAISGFVIAAIYMSYSGQQRAAFIQDEVASMQQNARAALSIMTSEIRMAGFDPTGNSGATIITAGQDTIVFSMDTDEDGNSTESGEYFTYELYTSSGIQNLGRSTSLGGNNSAVAEYIDSIEFQYLDEDGNVAATNDAIRSVVVSLLANSRTEDPDYTNNIVYETASGNNPVTGDANATATYGDGFRRRMFFGMAACRNMGL